jgi:hypothetical protein
MSQRIIVKASAALAALLVLSAPAVRAQDNCQSFRAIIPLTFDINAGWAGPVYAVIGSEVLIGKWSMDAAPQTSCGAASCQDAGGQSRIDFGGSGLFNPGDTVTVELQTAMYNLPDGFGVYRAMWKIVGGTGRFTQASGVGFESGPFVAWVDAKNIPQGQYIGEISADICGVKPPKNPQAMFSGKPQASIPAPAFPFYLRQYSPSVRK